MKTKHNKNKPKTIAPYLLNRDIRLENHTRLPESIKLGLREIARLENQSMSWVLEQAIIDYFGLIEPKYLNKKKRNGRI